ncbi:50S ribosomal protein L35 [Patescibacteria group bacterium]|nr:50S ribosomal protein L35 [Patescibacteria group bacterium]MBU4274557.1 50S ribosomal protein L35 [Patescibacteria group bacterium]MBU4367462.1 50S ribosomal protein L35 [Patescibacteria group bacterium]MBU4461782.1 50S ribosomal protein L35 [Patescibacteria group bacterium]MCG2700166.1 50S ribosomal protein L35 [Candidatus Parcubacteria bacterium]
MKAKQAILKRFKITKNGKVLRRPTGQNHYRAKKSGNKIRKSRKWVLVSKWETKAIKKMVGKVK